MKKKFQEEAKTNSSLSEKLRDFQSKALGATTSAIASLKTTRKKPCVDTGPTLWTFWFQFLDLLLFFTTHQRRICRFQTVCQKKPEQLDNTKNQEIKKNKRQLQPNIYSSQLFNLPSSQCFPVVSLLAPLVALQMPALQAQILKSKTEIITHIACLLSS